MTFQERNRPEFALIEKKKSVSPGEKNNKKKKEAKE